MQGKGRRVRAPRLHLSVLYPLGSDVHAMIDAFADWTA